MCPGPTATCRHQLKERPHLSHCDTKDPSPPRAGFFPLSDSFWPPRQSHSETVWGERVVGGPCQALLSSARCGMLRKKKSPTFGFHTPAVRARTLLRASVDMAPSDSCSHWGLPPINGPGSSPADALKRIFLRSLQLSHANSPGPVGPGQPWDRLDCCAGQPDSISTRRRRRR